MSSIQAQFPDIPSHRTRYAAIDPATSLAGSAAGKVVFITGASQGIGQATALAFAAAGARAVYLTARSTQALEATREQLRGAHPDTQAAVMACDVTQEDQVRAAVEDCVARFGGIDVADCNAGYLDKWSKIGASDTASWWRTWEVNLKGTYYVVRYTMQHLIASARKHQGGGAPGGYLVLISSAGAQRVRSGASDYQASKHVINRLCEFVDADHGEDGVKCFAIHPGGVPTALALNMPRDNQAGLRDDVSLASG
ncbi:MAG: SDR family oxidoreductase, partial [Acetobacteraceae bacterium]|nr:SDR family oxidoreductase [Acetobacteraceae bacterium]